MTDTTHASMTRAHKRLEEHERRIRVLELSDAGATQWRSETTKKLDGIEGTLKWVSRLIIGGLIMGAITFTIAGGLNVGP
ncbi:MAG: hemolysin XhlA family protein [Thalassovita sp.]